MTIFCTPYSLSRYQKRTLGKRLEIYERIPCKIHFECDFPRSKEIYFNITYRIGPVGLLPEVLQLLPLYLRSFSDLLSLSY